MALPPVLVEILVGAVWGCTNPLIKRAGQKQSKSVDAPGTRTHLERLLNIAQRYWPLALNLSASALFFLSLQRVEVSLAVPLSNATTFVFTSLVGYMLGEKLHLPLVLPGIFLTVVGIGLCIGA